MLFLRDVLQLCLDWSINTLQPCYQNVINLPSLCYQCARPHHALSTCCTHAMNTSLISWRYAANILSWRNQHPNDMPPKHDRCAINVPPICCQYYHPRSWTINVQLICYHCAANILCLSMLPICYQRASIGLPMRCWCAIHLLSMLNQYAIIHFINPCHNLSISG